MIGIEIKKVQAIQKKNEKEIEGHRTSALNNLNAIAPNGFNVAEQEYLAKVIIEFSKPSLLVREPNSLQDLADTIGRIPASSQPKGNTLKERILRALNYKGLRSSFYPKYFRDIGIKACVYCNSQLTVTILRSGGIKARFDVDHYQPKDDFPFLAICLFNLYPVCAACNRTKGVRQVKFDLYVDKVNSTSAFKFKLDESSKSHYLVNFEAEKIKYEFNEPTPVPNGYKTFQEVFSVQEVHNTQKDVVEELIIKSQIYTETYKELLRETFSKISLNDDLFQRVIVGNYVQDKDIHKRPLSKMMMDIARDLKIIS